MAQIVSFRIFHDSDAESPREWDNLGTFIMQHNRYEFGDRKFETSDIRISFEEDFEYHLKYAHDCTLKDVIYLPIYMYDHSGQTINTTGFNCTWDSGQIGYIYATKEKLRKEYSVKRISKRIIEIVEGIMKSEIEILDQWVQGDTYGYEVEYDDGTSDSCYGFYGNDPYINGMWEHWGEEEQRYYLEHNIEITY